MMNTVTSAALTTEMIEETIAGLSIQGRIILRLLLLQYLDITHDEILFMVADRPDPRCVSGKKPVTTMTQESIAAMIDRRNDYRGRVRLRRERTWLQCVALANLARMAEGLAVRAAALLVERGVSSEIIRDLQTQARSAVSSTTLRVLDEAWTKKEIGPDEYQTHRLVVEMQTQRRFAERFTKRLTQAERERQSSDQATLQDHEIGHIWGIPASTLAARKVKFLAQYLLSLRTKCSRSGSLPGEHPVLSQDLWNETMRVLARGPIERSIPLYDGLERTESALIEKLTTYAVLGIPEVTETKFWNSLVYGASSNAMHTEVTRTLFGLQRLVAIQKDVDMTHDALDDILLARTRPSTKESEAVPGAVEPAELTDLQRQILHNFVGEDVSGRFSDKW